MDEDHAPTTAGDCTQILEQLKETQQSIKELQILYSLNAVILVGLVTVVVETFAYLLFGATDTDQGIMFYKFSLLIGPSALFLLLLHFYELYGMVRLGEKSIPLTLDLMYFLYIGLSFPTMIGTQWYYQQHLIASSFLSDGWVVLVTLLCIEVPVALLLSTFLIRWRLPQRLPHFFVSTPGDHPSKAHVPVVHHRIPTPQKVYYFRKKPDVGRWEQEDCFVRLHQ